MSADEVQQYRAGFDWHRDFPETQLVKRTVDVEVHLAYEDEAFWVIVDESSIAESLDPNDEDDAEVLAALVRIQRHEDTSTVLPVLQSHGVSLGDLERALAFHKR
ncbi:MAG: hypothetical protein Q7T55_17835 [Solirubrobacteraceae bacterium]|nr:hypothetical protein [Solirubrobacteraceae bacterium]